MNNNKIKPNKCYKNQTLKFETAFEWGKVLIVFKRSLKLLYSKKPSLSFADKNVFHMSSKFCVPTMNPTQWIINNYQYLNWKAQLTQCGECKFLCVVESGLQANYELPATMTIMDEHLKRKNLQIMYTAKSVKRKSGLHLHGNEDADESQNCIFVQINETIWKLWILYH